MDGLGPGLSSLALDLDTKSNRVSSPNGMANSSGKADVVDKGAVGRADILDVDTLGPELA